MATTGFPRQSAGGLRKECLGQDKAGPGTAIGCTQPGNQTPGTTGRETPAEKASRARLGRHARSIRARACIRHGTFLHARSTLPEACSPIHGPGIPHPGVADIQTF